MFFLRDNTKESKLPKGLVFSSSLSQRPSLNDLHFTSLYSNCKKKKKKKMMKKKKKMTMMMMMTTMMMMLLVFLPLAPPQPTHFHDLPGKWHHWICAWQIALKTTQYRS